MKEWMMRSLMGDVGIDVVAEDPALEPVTTNEPWNNPLNLTAFAVVDRELEDICTQLVNHVWLAKGVERLAIGPLHRSNPSFDETHATHRTLEIGGHYLSILHFGLGPQGYSASWKVAGRRGSALQAEFDRPVQRLRVGVVRILTDFSTAWREAGWELVID